MSAIGYQTNLIHPTAFIAPDATVIGEVTLAANVSVWFGAVLRGDTDRIEVGEGSNVQDNAVLHTDPGSPCIIGADVTIGHGAVVHGCTVEDGALIGINATVLSGALVGTGSIIGAGAVVMEGVVIPPASLAVGIPAKVVRALDEVERSAGERGAAKYQERARSYKCYFEEMA